MFTIREKKKKFEGLKVAIVGDIIHSRVARSNIYALRKLGAKVALVGPPTLVPKYFERLGCEIHHDLETGIRDADVINLLRIQLERQRANLFPSIREYRLLYGLDTERLKWAKPDVLVMHPGPINRGVEISQEVADGEHSAINEQVTNGIAVRMAVLYLLAGGAGTTPENT
jgi:aspartate carbamoyltransferase catalytic subunit